jgi:hypothetical protein
VRDRGQILEVSPDDRRRRTVQTAHALRDPPFVDEHQPIERQRRQLEINVAERAPEFDRVAQLARGRELSVAEENRCLSQGKPAMLRGRFLLRKEIVSTLQPAGRDRRLATESAVVPGELDSDAGGIPR